MRRSHEEEHCWADLSLASLLRLDLPLRRALAVGAAPRSLSTSPVTGPAHGPTSTRRSPRLNPTWCARNSMPKSRLVNGVWEATFEGDCGRPYKYSIKMEGRQSGNAVLFKGTADLGQADGGVYDWIGRANNTEFIGFYTNAFTTGFFNLKRTN